MTGVTVKEGQAELPTPHSSRSFWHQQPSKLLLGHRTTERLPASADVIVIGTGIAGAFAARELVAQGRKVLMLEAREACWGATGRVRDSNCTDEHLDIDSGLIYHRMEGTASPGCLV